MEQKTHPVEFLEQRRRDIQRIYEEQVHDRERRVERARYYYDTLRRLLQFIVEMGKRVLQIQCDVGHFLSAVRPARGLGFHASTGHIDIARRRPTPRTSAGRPPPAERTPERLREPHGWMT